MFDYKIERRKKEEQEDWKGGIERQKKGTCRLKRDKPEPGGAFIPPTPPAKEKKERKRKERIEHCNLHPMRDPAWT